MSPLPGGSDKPRSSAWIKSGVRDPPAVHAEVIYVSERGLKKAPKSADMQETSDFPAT